MLEWCLLVLMADLHDEFRRIRNRLKTTYKKMAVELGMEYTDLINGIRGESRTMQAHLVREARRTYGLPQDWPENTLGDELVELELMEDRGRVLVPRRMLRADSKGWVTEGGTMMPWLEPGDIVVGRPVEVPVLGKAMIVREGKLLAVRVATFEDGEFVYRALSPFGPAAGVRTSCIPLMLVTGRFRQRGTYEVVESDSVNGLSPPA